MKIYQVLKNDVITNQWTSEFADANYHESSFGTKQHTVDDIIIPATYSIRVIDTSSQEAQTALDSQIAQITQDCSQAMTDLSSSLNIATHNSDYYRVCMSTAMNLSGSVSVEDQVIAKQNLEIYCSLFSQIQTLIAQRDIAIAAIRNATHIPAAVPDVLITPVDGEIIDL